MKNIFYIICILSAVTLNLKAGQLITVDIHNQAHASILNELDVHNILNINNRYLLYIEEEALKALSATTLTYTSIKENVVLDDLYLHSPKSNVKSKNNYLYSLDNLHVVQKEYINLKDDRYFPVIKRNPPVRFNQSSSSAIDHEIMVPGIDSIIVKINEDSLSSYLHRLEAFTHRLTGTDSSYAARDWIENKFRSFGYDSVIIDPFIGSQLWERVPVQSYNVIAYKIGNVYPERQIIIGAHFDAVPDCPGADDNGSGTAAMLELSRIFKDIETDVTMIFIAFDSEESWMYGSYHYADNAYARGDEIVLMINPDMIGHISNSNEANLYYGDEDGYARLWDKLSDSLVNISGYLRGSTASDHLPFQENGYDVIFVQEREFSTHYHAPSDSTTYINFNYMTRMTKGIAATAYTVSQSPLPIKNVFLVQVGDGQSMQISWDKLQSLNISSYEVYFYNSNNPLIIDTVVVSSQESSAFITNLTENEEYTFYVKAIDVSGQSSVVYDLITGVPNSLPIAPEYINAFPKLESIELKWSANNLELDFSHYKLYRDSQLVIDTDTPSFIDSDNSLGSDLHEYFVVSIDTDGNSSPIESSPTVISRAAVLEANRILAINRSNNMSNNIVDEIETGDFIRTALSGYNFDYYSDSSYYNLDLNEEKLNLFSMLDYGILIIGAESGLRDDIALLESNGGISEMLHYYTSIGGKLIVFGRWSNLTENEYIVSYTAPVNSYYQFYIDQLGLTGRVGNPTILTAPNIISAEMIGAKSQNIDYPDLSWDSLLVQQHTFPLASPYGIPLVTYAELSDVNVEILYTFNARADNPDYEDKPVAWKKITDSSGYFYFDIPLSFFNRIQAIEVIQTALEELMDDQTDVDSDDLQLPEKINLAQNYPNPFNPSTLIQFSLPSKKPVTLSIFNILGQKVKTIADDIFSAGTHTVEWDGTNQSGGKVSSGIYLYQLKVEKQEFSRKMVLLQ